MNLADYAADPLLSDFVALERGRTRMLVRRGYRDAADRLGLEGVPEGEGRVAGGRAEHPLLTLPDGTRAVVRRYRRGGLVRHLNRERYFGGHRAWDELRATEAAGRAGVRVPTVLAAAETRRTLGYTATLATQWVPDATDLAEVLRAGSRRQRVRALREAGRQLGRLHGAGIHHPDLNLRNFLVVGGEGDASPAVYLLDFDRAAVTGAPLSLQRRAAAVNRIRRSARKLGVPLEPDDWEAAQAGYGDGWPFAPPQRR